MIFPGLDRDREFDLPAEPAIGYFDVVEGAAVTGNGPDRFSRSFYDHVPFVQVQCEILGSDPGDLDRDNDLVIDDVEIIQGLPLNELQENQVLFIDLRKIAEKDIKLRDFGVFWCPGR